MTLTRVSVVLLALAVVSACASRIRSDGPPRRQPDIAAIPDAVPREVPRSASVNPPFYDLAGQRYYVMTSAKGYVERGVASWYGQKFHGRPTASGERYDMYAMTAAHKTLPLPAYARVTNLRNGKTAVVKINDRGPFIDNRIIDLSYAAATKLDIVQDGTGLVEVRVIDAGKTTYPAPSAAQPPSTTAQPDAQIYVQVGAFSDAANAERMRRQLIRADITNVILRQDAVNGATLHRVRVGPLSDVDAYDRIVARISALGIKETHLAYD